VISINNRCVDQIGADITSVVNIIAEMQRAVSLIKEVVTPAELEPSSSDILHSNQHQMIPAPSNVPPPESLLPLQDPSPTTTATTTMIRIQFRNNDVQRRTEPFQFSKSPIVACLCPIVLVEDASIMNHSHPPPCPGCTALASSTATSSSKHDALHLVSTTILLNIAMLFHRMAFRQNSMSDSDTHRRRGASSTAPYWMRAMELYELLIQLLNKDSLLKTNTDHMNSNNHKNDNGDSGCIRTRQYIAYMRMMKSITYNNYAQLCYETGNFIHYIPCMDGLYHQLHQLLPFLTDATTIVACDRNSTAVSQNHHQNNHMNDDTDDPSHFYSSSGYEPIRATIQLNVLVGQLLAIPHIARAA
jgi:hypothetical protein